MVLIQLLALLLSGYHYSDAAAAAANNNNNNKGFSILEATVDEIQLAFKQNKLTSRKLVEFYINRIQRLNPLLHGVIEVNPDAGELADKADYERKVKAPVSFSKLHGIPILVKDNIATKDKMNTTAGSLALLGSVVPRDAGVVAKLKKAGAIILGKASLTEWSAFRAYIPNGWSARGGQGVEKIKEYGQELLIAAEATKGIDKAVLGTLERQTRNGFVKLMRRYKLDALVACAGPSFPPLPIISTILAIGGFPGITVPAGYLGEVPFGIFFGGLKGYEPKLIEIAYGFEQATKIRNPPSL